VNAFILFAVVTIDILALMIIILFVIGACNCFDDPEVSGKNESPPPANIPPPNPQPNEQVDVDAPPPNPRPIYEGVAAILAAFDTETRNQVHYVFVDYCAGIGFKLRMPPGGLLGEFIFESIQDADAVFPEIKTLDFTDGRTPDDLILDGCGNQKFRELERISFIGDYIEENFSLTLLGTFDSLESIEFGWCKMRTLIFSGENLTAITFFEINDCPRLTNVTGIWNGGNPLFDRNSFKELCIKEVPNLNVADLNTLLTANATKCDSYSFERPCEHLDSFCYQNNGHEIKVETDRNNLKPSDLNALTDMCIIIAKNVPSTVNIPSRGNAQQPLNIRIYNWSEFHAILKFDGPENVANAGVIPRQNATATGEINTKNISNLQLNITCNDPVEKIIFNDAPREPVAIALTKKNSLFTVEFANLNAVPGELFLKEIPFIEGAADAVPPRAPNAAIVNPVVAEPHGLEIVIGGNSEAVSLWRKRGVGHYLAVGKARDVFVLERVGWQKVRKEEINGFEGGILFRRENILPVPASRALQFCNIA
jgi:hypothetical protein